MSNNLSSSKPLSNDKPKSAEIDIIVHLGAGIGTDVTYYQTLSPTHIHLFEGASSQCESLNEQLEAVSNVSVYHKVVNPFESSVIFQLTQPVQFSGIQSVNKFTQKFKNLKVIEESLADPFCLEDVVKLIPDLNDKELAESKTTMIVVQLNGLEFDLINQSHYSDLALFDNIIIQSIKDSSSSEYAKAKFKAFNHLLALGYELVSVKSDSVFVTYELLLNENQSASLKNDTKLSNSILRVNELNQQLSENVQSLKAELQKNEQRLSENDKKAQLQLEQYQLSASEEFLALTNEFSQLEIERDELQAERDKIQAERDKLKVTSDKLREERDKIQAERDKIKVTSDKVEAAKAQAVEQCNQLQAEKAQAVEQRDKLREDRDKIQAERDELKVTSDKVEAERAQAVEQRNQLQVERDKLEAEKAQIKSQLEQRQKDLQSQYDESTSHITKLQSKVTELEAELIERTTQRDNENKWHLEHKSWAESLNKQLETLKQEIKEMTRSSHLGQKILAKSQLDLEHLRKSYAEKVQSEQELIELVKELKQKLTLASKYYFKLQQEHPELLNAIEHVERD